MNSTTRNAQNDPSDRSNVVVFPGARGHATQKHNDNSQGKSGRNVQATLVGDPFSGSFKMTRGEAVTDTGAIAAIASPWWLPSLHDVSQFAAEWLPVLGAVWLIVQIGIKIHTTYWHK